MFFTFPKSFISRKPLPGVIQHVAWGDKIMLSHISFEPNAATPQHNHPQEQFMIVIEGELSFILGSEARTMKANDAVLIPTNVTHGVTAGPNGCVIVDILSPPREDYKTT